MLPMRLTSPGARRSLIRQRTRPTRSSICWTDAPGPELGVGLVRVRIWSSGSSSNSTSLSRLVYEVEEAVKERTQEVRVEVSEDGGGTYRQILVQ